MKKYLVTFISKKNKQPLCEVEVEFEEEPNWKGVIVLKATETLREIGGTVPQPNKFDWNYKEVK
jgi:hypothetical protein